jgi:hypothetical protein
VLLNGVPGKVFHYRRGVRQGDPLSALLFGLAADLLQSLINKEKEMGLLRLPINVGYTSDFPIIQYATSTGLKVNYSKSSMVPINLNPDRLTHLAATFNCQTGSLPFTYFGYPL